MLENCPHNPQIKYAFFPFLPTIHQLFLYTFHPVHSNRQDIQMHIVVLHENPGTPYIYLERSNQYQWQQADSFDLHLL